MNITISGFKNSIEQKHHQAAYGRPGEVKGMKKSLTHISIFGTP
jgi:hypothetical protein